jgi:hypothetical protein
MAYTYFLALNLCVSGTEPSNLVKDYDDDDDDDDTRMTIILHRMELYM